MNRRARRLLIVLPALGVLSLCLLLLVPRGPRPPARLERSEPPAEIPVVSSLPARKALAAVSLKGLVKSAYGEPVREGNVTFSRDGVSMKAVTLENDGTFSASLVPGQYRILVSSPIWGA